MSQGENTDRLERALRAFNAGDVDSYLELYADDIRLYGYTPEPMDKRSVRAFYDEVFAAFPDAQLTFHETLWDGDRASIRFTLSGTHRGPFMGAAATGRRIAFDGITILHFRDGQCHERWASADMLGLLVQIGAVPSPGERAEPPSVDAHAMH